MAEVSITVKDRISRTTDRLLFLLHNDRVRKNCNQFIAQALKPYVPMKTGELRESVRVYPDKITWGESQATEYTRYQYNGIVYGPNLPGWVGDTAGWRSPKTKYPTNRVLGESGDATLRPVWVFDNGKYRRANENDADITWHFGYFTQGTQHHWANAYQGQVKSETNKKITKYLKWVWKQRGVNV